MLVPLILGALALLPPFHPPAHAGDTLTRIKARGEVRCGVSDGLAIPPGWATRAVERVGNYGEMFERNLGSQSTLRLERGLNRLWTQGGLMYSPPFH